MVPMSGSQYHAVSRTVQNFDSRPEIVGWRTDDLGAIGSEQVGQAVSEPLGAESAVGDGAECRPPGALRDAADALATEVFDDLRHQRARVDTALNRGETLPHLLTELEERVAE